MAQRRRRRADSSNNGDHAVGERQRRYLIAPRVVQGVLQPMSTDVIATAIENMPDVKILRRVRSTGLGTFGAGVAAGSGMPEVIVAEMPIDRGEALRASAPANVVIEEDALLNYSADFNPLRAFAQSAILPPSASAEVRLQILGADNNPLPKANVYLYGRGFPTQGITDDSGFVSLAVSGGPLGTVQALYVKPLANHWERFITRPALADGEINTITLTPLSETFADFPETGTVGWGQKLLGLDQLPQNVAGRGVKIGIIDSGCDNSHPQLMHVRQGMDLTNESDPTTWTEDEIAHGTHCAGIIAASSSTQQGIRGFAPGAEIHALKVFPGGRFSDLIDALDECIKREIDVVNMSLGSGQESELVTQKIIEATNQGVACIVAAGNSGGPVQFPGTLANVLTVSAFGQLGTFPTDTFHAQAVLPSPGGVQNVFPAKFSCFGPSIGVSGPGVAILSCVPGGYAVWDGTSMAAPHITGLAALILAHHPTFQGAGRRRSSARVAQLFQTIKAASSPLFADAMRSGAGAPSLQRALGTSMGAATVPPQASPPLQPSLPQDAGLAQQQQQVLAAVLSNPAALQFLAQMRAVGII